MKQVSKIKKHKSEQGSAGVKLVIAGVILFLIGNAGYSYVPTAYQSQSFKQDMETAVIQGFSLPSTAGKPIDIIRRKVETAARGNDLPTDTFIEVKETNKVITARVYYKKQVSILPFGIWDYEYVFDHSATPEGFLTQ